MSYLQPLTVNVQDEGDGTSNTDLPVQVSQ